MALAALLAAGLAALDITASADTLSEADTLSDEQSLDGRGNNKAHPDWGLVGNPYSRVAAARYADGKSKPVTGPDARRVSNRVFNDTHQNLFSERSITQWGFVWGQFLDHTFGLREGRAPGDPQGEEMNIPFDPDDPLEEFTNDLGVIPFVRSSPARGTGVVNPRQQVNTVSSYIDAWAVYGGNADRLEWLRQGPVDGDPANNRGRLLLPGDYLPRRDSRGNPATAPVMEIDGRLRRQPDRAAVAGDVRANENIGLQATQTLFAREHNRVVSLLPDYLTEEQKFQIARRVVIAEQQYITYNEFLPALGVTLPAYTGYKPNVRTDLSNEFATVGYRGHSMIHGEVELETDLDRYTPEQLDAFQEMGIEVEVEGDEVELAVPLNVGFFNPDLVEQLQLGPLLQGIGLEAQYKNDEQIDNQLRSVLFQIPVPDNPDCLDGPNLPRCFDGVVDLGAIDIARGRDHGMPSYNQLRSAYGLAPRTSFTAITGEDTDAFPTDPELTPRDEINDPDSLDFLALFDVDGKPIDLDSDEAEESAVVGVRRTTVAARLKAIYGSVNQLDAFTGMLAERHVPGADFGELQLAIWAREFRNLRDGDRFFYGNDPGLRHIKQRYGIDYHRTLATVIASNTDIPLSDLNDNVFLVADDELPAPACEVAYDVTASWPGNFQVNLAITNFGSAPTTGWTLTWRFANGQAITQLWNGNVSQRGAKVRVANASWNGVIPAGGTLDGVGFNARWDDTTNPVPTHFTLNGKRCARG
ncbi:MAG: peroxidase family protein [Micromonosporaceae bacterium]